MWLYIPNTSTISASAPAGPGLISASSWQCQLLAQSVWWRGKPSPLRTWSNRCAKLSWMTRLCGAMCEPSQAAHGVELWMASLAASRVSRTALPGNGSGKTTSATSGAQHGASSSSPAPGSSSSKTSKACSPAAAPSALSETFEDLVLRLRSDYSARQKRAQAISATVSSSSQWPTAKAISGGPNSNREARNAGGPDLQEMVLLSGVVAVVDAPLSMPELPSTDGPARFGMSPPSLTWPTPDACVSNDGEEPKTFLARREREAAKGINGKDEMGLDQQARSFLPDQWMTPRTATGTYTRDRGQASLASSLPDHPISTVGEESSKIRRTLNPLFVEWLMGWPPGWTSQALTPPASNACACSAMALSAFKRRMRSALLALGLPPAAPPQQFTLFG